MPRIIAGSHRGRHLSAPAGRGTRPTSDRVREALFSRLEHELNLSGAGVLDLFAGSGALGLEAASRGAHPVVLVDSHRAAAATCQANASALGLPVTVQHSPARRFLAGQPEPFDLVLIDPPYDLAETALAGVLTDLVPWLTEQALIVLERSSRSPEPTWPAGIVRIDDRSYGETRLWFAEPSAVSCDLDRDESCAAGGSSG